MSTLVTIGWFTEPWNAHIAKGRLEAEGVAAWVVHEHHVWGNWMYSLALGQVKLQVRRADVEHGLRVLERCRQGNYRRDLERAFGPLPEPRCAACGSDQVRARVGRAQTITAFAFYLLTGVAYPPPQNLFECTACKHQWAGE